MVKNLNDYTKIIAQALDEMKKTQGAAFSLEAVNLAELQRMTGISRAKLRRLKENQFETLPDKRCGRKAPKTKLTGYTDDIDALLRKDVTNSSVIFDRLLEQGYQGGIDHYQGLHPLSQVPDSTKTACSDTSGKSWKAVCFRTRRMLPDGLGIREC